MWLFKDVPLAACSTEQTLSGLVDWDTDRLSPLDSYWQGKMETTRMHRHTVSSLHSHTHRRASAHEHTIAQCKTGALLPSLEAGLSVLYVQVTDAAVGVNTSGQKKQKQPKDEEQKTREKRREGFSSLGEPTQSCVPACAFIWERERKREREGGRGREGEQTLPSLHQLPSRSPWSHSQPWRSPQAEAG